MNNEKLHPFLRYIIQINKLVEQIYQRGNVGEKKMLNVLNRIVKYIVLNRSLTKNILSTRT